MQALTGHMGCHLLPTVIDAIILTYTLHFSSSSSTTTCTLCALVRWLRIIMTHFAFHASQKVRAFVLVTVQRITLAQ